MPSIICADVFNDCNPCAGEIPYSNLSAEQPEPHVFVSPRVIIRKPPITQLYQQLGCKRWCYSEISQADADACASSQALECATVPVPMPPVNPDPPFPPVSFPLVSVFATEPATSFGEDPGVFNIARTGSTSAPLNVQFTLSGQAQNGVDYETLPYSVTIDAGDSNVDVIVIPMDTGEVVSKNVILTILGGSNYSPGAMPSDMVVIGSTECGDPKFRVAGWGPALAEAISDLMPDADDSELPEWDGILRQRADESIFRSNADCYSINGKSIEITVNPGQTLTDKAECPSGWIDDGSQPGCSACVFGIVVNHTFVSDLLSIQDNGLDMPKFYVSQATGIIGSYKEYISPICDNTFLGQRAYTVSGDGFAHYQYGDVLLSIGAL